MASRIFLLLLAAGSACSVVNQQREAAGRAELATWIGQMVMVGFRGTELSGDEEILRQIAELELGGVVLFDRDVELKSDTRNILSADQLRRLTEKLQQAASSPLLIGIDQEGGRIARLKPERGFPETLSQQELGRIDREETTRRQAAEQGRLLKSLGINLNFAPVLDLNTYADNPIIGALGRSYGGSPAKVVKHAAWTIEEFHKAGVLVAVKHFPGHGSSRSDSHLGLPDVTPYWSRVELEPFRRILSRGLADMVMTAHLYNQNWDPERPATLSPHVVTDLLRTKLGFDDVVVSDDLGMGAIVRDYSLQEAVELSLNAGADMLLFGNNLAYDKFIAVKAVRAVRSLIEQGRIKPERLRESFLRIERLKKRLDREGGRR